MDYVEKRKQGRKRIFKKMIEENDKKERIYKSRSYSVALKNKIISSSIYKNITIQEKKLYRYILSLIKKSDDINTTFILVHKNIRELFNHNFTSKDIYSMLKNISNSFDFEVNEEFWHTPIFKLIKTSKRYDTTEIVFNEFFNSLIFDIQAKGHFLKYELANILEYKNLHSIELFELILSITKENQREEIVSIDFDIDRLKILLNCEKYQTKDFIRDVIKKSIEEINKYNKSVLGGTVTYKYNRTKKTITFYTENISYMLKNEKKKN